MMDERNGGPGGPGGASGPLGDAQGALNSALRDVRTQIESGSLTRQVEERPWAAFGAALAAGYLLGSMGGSSGASMQPPSMVSQTFERIRSGPRVSNHDFANRHGGMHQTHAQHRDSYQQQSPGGFGLYGQSQGTYGQGTYGQHGESASGHSQAAGSYGQSSYGQGSYGQSASMSSRRQTGMMDDLLGPARGELDLLRNAAIVTARRWLRDTLREVAPSMRQQIDELDRKIGGATGT